MHSFYAEICTSISFPSTVENIESPTNTLFAEGNTTNMENPLFGCTGLESIKISDENPSYQSTGTDNAILRKSDNDINQRLQ